MDFIVVDKEVDIEDGTKCTVIVIVLNNKRLCVLLLQIFGFTSLPPTIAQISNKLKERPFCILIFCILFVFDHILSTKLVTVHSFPK